MKRLRLTLYGQVQGVFFRAETQNKAKQLGLTGWVKNNSDETMSVVAEGEQAELEELRKFCRQGPPMARVDEMTEEWESVDQKLYDDFKVEY